MKKKYNKIAILGNSKKFVKEVKKNYIYNSLEILSWRNLDQIDNFGNFNLIIVCGFNFNLFYKSFRLFSKKNIDDPFRVLKKISNDKSVIIYINTQKSNNKKRFTFSRYRYAKEVLAYKIDKNFKKKYIFNADLITVNKKISINASIISKLIFILFLKFKFIRKTEIKEIFPFINRNLNSKRNSQIRIRDCLLNVPRTQFIDRALRLILG